MRRAALSADAGTVARLYLEISFYDKFTCGRTVSGSAIVPGM
jgi:hypothetical protein